MLRGFRGSEDLEGMAAVINSRVSAEGGDYHTSVESLAQQYEHLKNCDPERDIVVAEEAGTIIGYARTVWEDVAEGYRQYWVISETLPGHELLLHDLYAWAEGRAIEVAAEHPPVEKYLVMWADQGTSRADVLARRGYVPFRYSAEMVRPHLDLIPDRTLPDGVEVRPVDDSQLRSIWEADVAAFRDAWGYTEPSEEDWEAFLDSPNWDPSLWQVAWAGQRVVGQVRSFIDRAENEHFGRLRGYTEDISTAREWRGRGIATALICSSLRLLKEAGMQEAALGVDLDSPTGAPHLYRSLGYRQTRLEAVYRREIPT